MSTRHRLPLYEVEILPVERRLLDDRRRKGTGRPPEGFTERRRGPRRQNEGAAAFSVEFHPA